MKDLLVDTFAGASRY